MNRNTAVLFLLVLSLAASAWAGEGATPTGVPPLQHVWVIMMENHGYDQIFNNPNAPFTTQYAQSANHATNYYAVAHPSLTNYLEAVGGSNFGVLSDNDPDWHSNGCLTNLATGTPNLDNGSSPNICPIAGTGTDAATPAIDYTNETSGPPGEINIDGQLSFAAASNTSGKTIADQLVAVNASWKTYQESLPPTGADGVNYADGFFSNLTNFSTMQPMPSPPLSSSGIVKLYAAKHNPFVYFQSVQEGENPALSLQQVADFDGPTGLYADLRAAKAPAFSFIAPNQCNDQHGRGNGGPFCQSSVGGMNPALIARGDITLKRIVTAIKASQAWKQGHNAIVVLWDENDYSVAPVTNRVLLIVDTNYGVHGRTSSRFYTHFSLLKSLEAGFGLPCLNHACDGNANVMSDLFGDE